MRILGQRLSDGVVEVMDAPAPQLAPGFVRVRTAVSCISPGTEGTKIVTGKKSLLGKARARPDQVRQVFDMVGQLGVRATIRKVRARLSGASPLGYSLAGTVIEVGEGVEKFTPGDVVACGGGGYANHADEVVVPVNLVARVPDGVGPESAAMTTLGAIALQGIRLAGPTLGENAVVVGLGVIGLMACQLLKANGCRVFGIDIEEAAVERARQGGVLDAGGVIGGPVESEVEAFTRGIGADIVLICAGTSSSEPVALAGRIARQRARVIVVGAVGMEIPREEYYRKEISFAVSCSYGPGRYDPEYEEQGRDYPVGHVRWTEGRNMEAILDLMASGRFDPLPYVTHRFAFEDAPDAYEMIAGGSESYGGILLSYPETPTRREGSIEFHRASVRDSGALGVGFVGAGSFGQTFLLPPFQSDPRVRFTAIATRTGLGAADVGKRFGFKSAVAALEDVLADADTGAVVIATRHDQHGPATIRALEAGKHVFVEKPLCLNENELAAIADTLRRLEAAGALPVLQVGYNRRFSQAAVAAKQHFGGEGAPLSIVYRVNAGHIARNHWTQDPMEGGGRIVGEVCHFIDLMQFITNARPEEVAAFALASGNREVVREDNIVVNVRFDNGSIATLAYLAEGAPAMAKERVEILGMGRSAVIDNFQRVELSGKRGISRRRCRGKGHDEEVGAFVDATASGEMSISIESMLLTSRATFAIRDSLRDGRAVAVSVSDLLS